MIRISSPLRNDWHLSRAKGVGVNGGQCSVWPNPQLRTVRLPRVIDEVNLAQAGVPFPANKEILQGSDPDEPLGIVMTKPIRHTSIQRLAAPCSSWMCPRNPFSNIVE